MISIDIEKLAQRGIAVEYFKGMCIFQLGLWVKAPESPEQKLMTEIWSGIVDDMYNQTKNSDVHE